MTIEFESLGTPKAQMRHRTTKVAGFLRNYDPSAEVKENFLLTVQRNAPPEPFTGPIKLTATFYLPRPKGHYRSGKNSFMLRDDAPEYHTSKPDADNFSKLVMDALNGKFWKDDSQICILHAEKLYSERPRTYILIQTL